MQARGLHPSAMGAHTPWNKRGFSSVNINAMRPRRRLVALFALLAIAWTSLWPLVSAAHAAMANEAMPLCHQAGTMVAMDEAPTPEPGSPAHSPPRFHCPLCVMAFYAGFAPQLHVEPPVFRCRVEFGDAHCAPTPDDFSLALPESRAPPAHA